MSFAIVISALVFSFAHRYNLAYLISGFAVGLLLAAAYWIGKERREPAVLLPFIVHSIFNISFLTINLVIESPGV